MKTTPMFTRRAMIRTTVHAVTGAALITDDELAPLLHAAASVPRAKITGIRVIRVREKNKTGSGRSFSASLE